MKPILVAQAQQGCLELVSRAVRLLSFEVLLAASISVTSPAPPPSVVVISLMAV